MMFSDRIRRLRTANTWTQEKLASELGVNQATVSQWENGRQRPDDAKFSQLAKLLEVTVDQLLLEVRQQFPFPITSPSFLAETEFLEIQQQLISQSAGRGLDICLIGPDTLPLPDSSRIRQSWVDNISAGINYRIIWFLDYVREGTFRSLGPALREVGTRANGARIGRITHYGAFGYGLQEDELSRQANLRDYERLAHELTPFNNLFHLADESDASKNICRRLLKFWTSFCSIGIVLPHETSREATASLTLRNVMPRPEAAPVNTWLFLGLEQTSELVRLMDDLGSWCSKQTPLHKPQER